MKSTICCLHWAHPPQWPQWRWYYQPIRGLISISHDTHHTENQLTGSPCSISRRLQKCRGTGNHATLMLIPIFLLYSWLCFAYDCVYTCSVHTDCDCTVDFPLWPIRASHPNRRHHTHTHTHHTESNVELKFPDWKLMLMLILHGIGTSMWHSRRSVFGRSNGRLIRLRICNGSW